MAGGPGFVFSASTRQLPPLTTPGGGIQRPLLGFRGLLPRVWHINSYRPTHIDTKIINLFFFLIVAVGTRLNLKESRDRMPQTLASSLEEEGAPGAGRGRCESAPICAGGATGRRGAIHICV